MGVRKAWDWHLPIIGALGFLLWTTNRRRVKPNFDMSGEADIEAMLPTLVGLTEGAVDHGNSIEIVQNGALFDRPRTGKSWSSTAASRTSPATESPTSGPAKLEKAGKVDAHVAYASPRGSLSSVQLLYYLAINAARRELLIQNPYFLPHDDAIDSLKQAVKRGVEVQVMLPASDRPTSTIDRSN